ncbi:MAG: alpha/beta hydrolase [Solirubrobacterales bacterium]|jgi:pimeloyl-ACP methyl ester carboxylesterase|nr:alpha/beta hydrolase [Solirubrobacterales bacterium]
MPTVGLPTGTIHYFEYGPPDGRPVVFVHGYLMGGELFADLGRRLGARGLRCLAPTWPLGAQTEPMTPGTDLTPAGVAAMIAAFLDALDLEDVVLLGNDTGGALCQLVAADHPTRLGAVVLTNCDAFENFPPSFFKALVKAARLPGGFRAVLAPMRTAAARRSPLGFGLLSHHDVDHLAREWVRPIFERPAVLEDLRRFTVALEPAVTLGAAARLPAFERPVLLAWAMDDKLFPVDHAERLAALLPDGRVERIEDSRAFSMIDQPARLTELVAAFAEAAVAHTH